MIIAELNSFGITETSITRISQELGESSTSRLENIFKTLWANWSDALTENERVNRMIIRYAIMDAIQGNHDSLNDLVVNNAREKASILATTLGTYNIQESEVEEDAVNPANKREGKRTRNPDLYPHIKRMVQNDPEAHRDVIVAEVVKTLDANEGTATMYFYKARKELGLKNKGRGKK